MRWTALPHPRRLIAGVAAAALLAAGAAACGSDDDGSGGGEKKASKGTSTDQAFLQAMIPHLESAIDMAKVAKRRGQHGGVKELAADIVTAQSD